jgi:hypothetical protein
VPRLSSKSKAAAVASPPMAAPGAANTSIPGFGPKKRQDANSEYIDYTDVPIFTTRWSEDTTPEDLQGIIDLNNQRIADTGDGCPLIIGHTSDEDDSERVIVGRADSFRLGTFGKLDPVPAILVDCHILPEYHEPWFKLSRRSVEIWRPKDGGLDGAWIDAIAILGGTTPRFDLGPLDTAERYSRKTASKSGVEMELVCCELRDDEEPAVMADMTQDDFDKRVLSLIESSVIGKYVQKCMEADEQQPHEDDEHTGDEPVADETEKNSADDAEGDDDKQKDENKMSRLEKLKLERDDARLELTRMQKQTEAQQSQIEELQKKFRKQERQGILERLKFVDGVSFDLAEEVDYVLDMNEAQFERHLDKIKTRYQRAPLGFAPIKTAPLAEANGGAGTELQQLEHASLRSDEARQAGVQKARAAAKYAMEHKCSVAEAMSKV